MPSEDFPIEYQNGLLDCGPTCLKMIADYYAIPSASLSALYERCCISGMKASLSDMKDAASGLGLRTLLIKGTIDNLINDVPLPAIILWRGCHYIVIYESNEKYIDVVDPAQGYIRYTHEEFQEGWYLQDENSGVLMAFGQQ